MSDHDVLMSHLLAVRAELEQYVKEYSPFMGPEAEHALSKAIVLIHNFPFAVYGQ